MQSLIWFWQNVIWHILFCSQGWCFFQTCVFSSMFFSKWTQKYLMCGISVAPHLKWTSDNYIDICVTGCGLQVQNVVVVTLLSSLRTKQPWKVNTLGKTHRNSTNMRKNEWMLRHVQINCDKNLAESVWSITKDTRFICSTSMNTNEQTLKRC